MKPGLLITGWLKIMQNFKDYYSKIAQNTQNQVSLNLAVSSFPSAFLGQAATNNNTFTN